MALGLRATKSLGMLPGTELEDELEDTIPGSPLSDLSEESMPQPFDRIFEEVPGCSMLFEGAGEALPSLGRLEVTFQSGRTLLSPDVKSIAGFLDEVLKQGRDFVACYDFRVCTKPRHRIVEALRSFHREHEAEFCRRCQAIAVLVSDSLFHVVAGAAAGSFSRASSLPQCPQIICHTDATADAFFQAVRTTMSGGEGFVMVAGVQEPQPDGKTTYGPCSVAKLTRFSHSDVSSMPPKAPMTIEPVMHTLNNGDVRVIQSPPSDVMFRRAAAAPTLGAGGKTQPANKGKHSTLDLHLVEALRFQCHPSRLRQLLGTYLHLEELLIDADAESEMFKGHISGSPVWQAAQKIPATEFVRRCRQAVANASDDKKRIHLGELLKEGVCFAGVALMFSTLEAFSLGLHN